MKNKENRLTFGISFKTSLICGIVVLSLLTISSFISVKLQSGLSRKMITAFEQNEKKSLEEESKKMEAALVANSKINLKICSGVAQSYLYNFSQDTIGKMLETFGQIEGILAIRVLMWTAVISAHYGKPLPFKPEKKFPMILRLMNSSRLHPMPSMGMKRWGR